MHRTVRHTPHSRLIHFSFIEARAIYLQMPEDDWKSLETLPRQPRFLGPAALLIDADCWSSVRRIHDHDRVLAMYVGEPTHVILSTMVVPAMT